MKFNLINKFFKSNQDGSFELPDGFAADEKQKELIKEISLMKPEKRMGKVIFYGDSADPRYYPLIKWTLLYDSDISVKFSALKRIHLFKADPDVVKTLESLGQQGNNKNLEPYYSMAMSRVGIISKEEFEKRINR
ncbi:hypothetical protein [Mucilaginibacter sp.]|uniref:hypothetical protein n=1 Tax=Mucilaginibacter sp. TaxID=1882438 RepID=UPI0025D2D31F|nr:hypothetical protein [Mucilaginibacter sp.]